MTLKVKEGVEEEKEVKVEEFLKEGEMKIHVYL